MQEYTKGKIVFLGTAGVGKTAIINCYNQISIKGIEPTIAVNSIKLSVNYNDKEVLLNVWDTAGQENYKCLLPLYIRRAHVGVIVFALNDSKTYKDLDAWISGFREQSDCQIIIVGNKCDCQPFDVNIDKVTEELHAKGYSFFQTSALTGDGVELLFNEIAKIVDQNEGGAQSQSIPFQPEIAETKKEKGCC